MATTIVNAGGDEVLENFGVIPGQTVVVSAAGLMADEVLAVEYLACQDCSEAYWIPYSPCGEQIKIDQYYNPVSIETPGTYRVVAEGDVSSEVQVCTQSFGGAK